MADASFDEWDDWQPVVVDNGSYSIKAGFSGDDAPRAVFPTIIGRFKNPPMFRMAMAYKDACIGDEAVAKKGILNINNTIQKGIITNFEDMGKIWKHTFYNELCIAPEEHAFLFTESPLNTKLRREKTTEIMFESHDVPRFYLAATSPLVLYGTGNKTSTGIVIESGCDITNIVPVFEGYPLINNVTTLQLGGNHLTNYLMTLLQQKNISVSTEIANDIKEKLTYDTKIEYELPDGNIIIIENEIYDKSIEPLFNPIILNINSKGIAQLLHDTIIQCDSLIRYELFQNIVLSGGNTMFKNITKRLNNDLCIAAMNFNLDLVNGYCRRHYVTKQNDKLLYSDVINLINKNVGITMNIVAPEFRKYITWIGGSIVTSMSTFKQMWITKEEYEEFGSSVVHKKCTGV